MTRRTLFLAAIMVLASLGAGAQATSTPGARAPVQQNAATQNTNVQQSSNSKTAELNPVSQPDQPGAQTNPAGEQPPAVSNGQLPQTSTILPLLGLIGLGSLVAGFFSRR
jgi:hypothetical protein